MGMDLPIENFLGSGGLVDSLSVPSTLSDSMLVPPSSTRKQSRRDFVEDDAVDEGAYQGEPNEASVGL